MRNSLLRHGVARRKDGSASAASSNASTWGQTKISWDIHQCPLAKRCRARWEKLEPVQGDTAIRFCAACERSVYLCQTDEDLAKHSALGRCVALEVMNIGVAHVGESLPIDRWSEGYLDAQPKRGPERKSGNDDLDPDQPMLEPDRSGG